MGNFAEQIKKDESGILIKLGEILEKQTGHGLDSLLESGQRSAEWFEQRRGKFTGSKIKDLMTCERSASKYEWGRPEKLISFGDSARMYIFEKYFERKTGKIVHTRSTAEMRYGVEHEVTVKELLIADGIEIQDCDFVDIEILQNIAGASPDGRYQDKNVEIKCSTSVSGFYKRVIQPFDQGHIDFWQVQTEMMAQNLNETLYVVTEPPEDLSKPPEKYWSKFVPKSPIHQTALIYRCKISDMIIKELLNGTEFTDAFVKVCGEVKINELL